MKKLRKIILFVSLSLALGAVVCEYKGDLWEQKLRTAIYRLRQDTIPSYAATFTDEKGIPFVLYAESKGIKEGKAYNSTVICNYAIDYYKLIRENKDPLAREKFGHCIEWLANNISCKDNYAWFEFNWQQPFYDSVGVPWTSGMTSGRAMEAFTDAYQLYHSQIYLDLATRLLRGFYIPIQSGGFNYKESGGWWYEEYAHTGMHTPRVLDGHIYAFMGVYKFWLVTRNDSAAQVLDQGIRALKSHLPGYDKGDGWSYYDAYHKVSDEKYHKLLTSMMKDIWDITKDPFFYEYYRKWDAPLRKPYVFRIFKEKNRSGLVLYFLLSMLMLILVFSVSGLVTKKIRE